MRVAVLAVSLAFVGMLGGPAMANEKDDADIRCVIALLNQAGADSTQADTASYMAAYFYGKLFTRNPDKPPASLVTDRSIPTTTATLQADLTRCAGEFAAANKKIDALNAEVLARVHKSGALTGTPAPATTPQTAPPPAIGGPTLWPGQVHPARP